MSHDSNVNSGYKPAVQPSSPPQKPAVQPSTGQQNKPAVMPQGPKDGFKPSPELPSRARG